MNGSIGSRKRKRPFHLDETFQSSSEDERKIIKKKLLESTSFNVNATFHSSSEEDEESGGGKLQLRDDGGCALCGHLRYGGCEVGDRVEDSQHTYADVLAKLLGGEDSSTDDTALQQGGLCTVCKIRLQNLYRLQRELREEKKEITNIYTQSTLVRQERKIDKNVDQIIQEMRSAKDKQEQSRNRKLFKNNSDTILDYSSQGGSEEREEEKRGTEERCKRRRSRSNEEAEEAGQERRPVQNKSSNLTRFRIESLQRKRVGRYLVKWEQFSDEDSTWELAANIPSHITKFYDEDPSRLGQPAPAVPDKFQQICDENTNSGVENLKESDNFDINRIIDDLYKDDNKKTESPKLKIKLKKRLSTGPNFYIEPGEGDPPKKPIPTKAALKQNDEWSEQSSDSQESSAATDSLAGEELVSLLREEQEIESINIFSSPQSGSHQAQARERTKSLTRKLASKLQKPPVIIPIRNDVEAQQTPEKKDSKKTTILGKIFVSTPERRRSTEENSSEALIQAVLREEDIYNIEALVEKKGSKYLVKWENYPSSQNTWEPKSSIPPFIIKYYEADLGRLGRPVPAPPSPESEYIPAVDSMYEDSDGLLYEPDDDWRPSERKQRKRVARKKSGAAAGAGRESSVESGTAQNNI